MMHVSGLSAVAAAGGSSTLSSDNHANGPDNGSSNGSARSSLADPLFLTFYSVSEEETHALLAALDSPFFRKGKFPAFEGTAAGPLQLQETIPSPEAALHTVISEKLKIPALLERLRALSMPPPSTPSTSGPSPPSCSPSSLSPAVAAAVDHSGCPTDALNPAGGATVVKKDSCVEGISDKAADSLSRSQTKGEGNGKQQLSEGNPKTQVGLPRPSSPAEKRALVIGPESADPTVPSLHQNRRVSNTSAAGNRPGILRTGSKSSRASSANSTTADRPGAVGSAHDGEGLPTTTSAERESCSSEDSRRQLQHAIVCDLFLNALFLCKEEEFSPEATSTFLGILKKTLEDSMTAEMSAAESFKAFRNLLLKYAIQRPPLSIKVFTVRTLQTVMNHVVETFYRHYQLYVHCFVPLKHLVLQQTPTVIPPRLLRSAKPKKTPRNCEPIPNLGSGLEAMQDFLKDLGDDTDTASFTKDQLTPGILPESEWNELLWGEEGDDENAADPFSSCSGLAAPK